MPGDKFLKAFKYILIALTVAALLAAAGWFVRNSLIQRFSKRILSEYDIELVDISLDALASDSARIGYLKLVHAKGTTIVIENLTLPINTPNSRFDQFVAERVSIITETRDEEAPFELARLVDQFLSLTSAIPRTDIRVSEFSTDAYPVVRELSWTLSETEQSLTGTVESLRFAFVVKSTDGASHEVRMSLLEPDGSPVNTVIGTLQQGNQGMRLSGNGILDLPGMENVSKLAGIVPSEILFRSGAGELVFVIEAPYNVAQSPAVTASLTPVSPWHLDYVRDSGDSTDVKMTSSRPIEIAATFPTVVWSLQSPQMSLLVTDGEWKDVPVALSQLSCNSGPHCLTETSVSWAGAKLPFGNAAAFEFSAALEVTMADNGVAVHLAPEASLSLKTLSTSSTEIALLEAKLVSEANLDLLDNGWRFGANSVDASIQSMAAGDSMSVSMPIFLETIKVSDLDQTLSAAFGIFAPAISANLNQQTLALPGIRGSIAINGRDVHSALQTVGLQQDGSLTVRHNIDTGVGLIRIANAAVSFASKKASKRISPWTYDGDLIAGVVGLNGQAKWSTSGDQFALDGQASLQVENAAGFYADTAFTGLSTGLEVGYTSTAGFTTKPSSLSVALVDVGLPVEDITADYSLDLNSLAVDMQNLRMTAFGGIIRADPFSFRTDRDRNNLTLHADLIQLDQVLSLKEFEAISVTGSIGASLPVTIERDKVTIAGGHLLGDAPGGVIRYGVANASDTKSTSSMDLVTRALSNFVYDTLTSDIDYNEAGDLILKMQLKGRNPDMEGNRPVILNLSVENNVPQMLRSLQAARAVEEVLENRVKK
jgi:hypothetical protein